MTEGKWATASPFSIATMHRMKPLLPLLLLLSTAHAQAVVYRCPGPPVLYTDQLTPKEAKEKGCRSIEGAPVSVVSAPRARPAAATAAGTERLRIDQDTQRARDADRRKVLETELREAEARLESLKKDFREGEPERTERNLAVYQQRVADMKAAISRQEADVQALRRELSKLN